jgi:anti-sigma factor RsiW
MSFSDETLMAYADGELDASTRTALEQAMRFDPALAERVRQHKAMRSNVFAAFAPIVDEPVPQRLQAVGRSGKVIHLDSKRGRRAEAANDRRWSWPQWGAIAATLVVGVLAGSMGLRGIEGETQVASGADGVLAARGKLAEALNVQLAGGAQGEVKIGVSFVAKDGNYCRSFMVGVAAGLACKDGAQWKIPVMAQAAPAADGAYRQAGSEVPAAVLDAVDQRINGKPLDAAGEQAAQSVGWKR